MATRPRILTLCMTKRILQVLSIFIIGAVGGIAAEQIFWPYFVERPLFYKYHLGPASIFVTEKKEVVIRENEAITDAIERAGQATIGIKTLTKDKKIIEGSGLILTADGLAVTLASLVPSGSKSVFYRGRDFTPIAAGYEIVKLDVKQNLALIKLGEKNLTTLGFASSLPKLGENVFLAGLTFAGEQLQKTANQGIVRRCDENLILTNISENAFLAGSPVFNIKGDVVGLSMLDKEGKITAIPIAKVKDFAGL